MERDLGRFGDGRLDKGGRSSSTPWCNWERRAFAGGREATARAVAGRHVLAFQDTSEFNFRTSEDHRRGLGAIGKGVGRGILLHAMIVADAEHGDVLGLAGAQAWTRPEPIAGAPKSKKKKRRPAGEKEWRRWVETPQDAK